MEPLVLCYMMDQRWLCKLNNRLHHYLLVLPVVVNLASMVFVWIYRQHLGVPFDQNLIVLLSLFGALALLSLFMLIKTSVAVYKNMKNYQQNLDMIRQFTLTFETKKTVWSWYGLAITLMSIVQTVINNNYIQNNSSYMSCQANHIRFWIDVVCWSYMAIIILAFLLLKLGFLVMSWKNPEFYLRYREVIQKKSIDDLYQQHS